MLPGRRRILRITLFTILFILLFMLTRLFIRTDDERLVTPDTGTADGHGKTDSSVLSGDSAVRAADSLRRTEEERKMASTSKVMPNALRKTIASIDTLGPAGAMKPEVPRDITPPYIHAEPGPGLHPAPIEVTLLSDEPAVIRFRIGHDTTWVPYATPIPVKDSLFLTFQGTDSAGNVSEQVSRLYVIAGPRKIKCPADMAVVEAGKVTFCIDKYEWPNKKGALPQGYLNWYMAYDSCRTYKKRLCSADEWNAACGGKAGSDYPYGNAYEIRTCNTESLNALPSGSLEECRSFFGVYDLSGNLREWTSTRASRNERHYQVYGGFWDNRGASKCNSTQYSFFPENKFTTIGFRCCKEAE